MSGESNPASDGSLAHYGRLLIKACHAWHETKGVARTAGGVAYRAAAGAKSDCPFDDNHPLAHLWWGGWFEAQALGQRAVLPSANHATGVAVDDD